MSVLNQMIESFAVDLPLVMVEQSLDISKAQSAKHKSFITVFYFEGEDRQTRIVVKTLWNASTGNHRVNSILVGQGEYIPEARGYLTNFSTELNLSEFEAMDEDLRALVNQYQLKETQLQNHAKIWRRQ